MKRATKNYYRLFPDPWLASLRLMVAGLVMTLLAA